MEDRKAFDIAVVGGGLAGLLATARLARSGRSVALVAPARTADRRTTALLGESITAIREVGAWDAVQAVVQPIRTIRLVDGTSGLMRAPEIRFDAEEVGLEAFGYNIPNERLLAALDAAITTAGAARFAGTAGRIEPGAEAVAVDVTGGPLLSARLVVAADGRNSPARAAAGIAFDAKPDLGQAALVTSFSHGVPHDDISTEFHTGAGPFTFVPLPGHRSSLVWVTTADEADRLKALTPSQLGVEIERHGQSVLGTVGDIEPVQVFRLASGSAARLAANRVALVGESAHVLPPIAAQGFNLTVRDIEVLAELVEGAADPGDPDLLDAYDRRRRPDLGLRSIAVGLLNRSLVSRSPVAQLARSAGLHALGMVPALRRSLIRQGLGIG